jgi:hypothetical protein
MAWQPYQLDHLAQEIVLKARHNDPASLNQAHKMRATCAYGLERFWGEHLRLAEKEPTKAAFVADVWRALVGVLKPAGVTLPATVLAGCDQEASIQDVSAEIWSLSTHDHQTALAVLTALCDAVVWWTQRLKTGTGGRD